MGWVDSVLGLSWLVLALCLKGVEALNLTECLGESELISKHSPSVSHHIKNLWAALHSYSRLEATDNPGVFFRQMYYALFNSPNPALSSSPAQKSCDAQVT